MAWNVALEKYFNIITSISCFGEKINGICLFSGVLEGLFKCCFKDSVAEGYMHCLRTGMRQLSIYRGIYLLFPNFMNLARLIWGILQRIRFWWALFLQPCQQLQLPSLALISWKTAIILIIFQCKVKSCQAYSKYTVSFPRCWVFFGFWKTNSHSMLLLLTSSSLCIFGSHTFLPIQ